MRRLAFVALLVLLAAACGGEEEAGTTAPAGAATAEIVDIDGVEPIREQFEADAGKRRLLLVFSPT